MKSFPLRNIAALAIFLLCACTTEQVSRNVYEGTKARNESLKSTPLEQGKSPSMSYEEYEKERRRK